VKSPLVRKFDFALMGGVAAICLAGLVLVFSSSHDSPGLSHLVWKQAGWMVVGVGFLLLFYLADTEAILQWAYPLYWVTLALLVVVALVGHSSRGSQRWLRLGFFHFQPSEMAKLAMILVMARYLKDHDRDLRHWEGLVPPFLLVGVPMLFILKQPDLGTAMVLVPLVFVMLYVAGARIRYLVTIIAAGLASTPLAWHFMKDYQRRRWLTFLDPETDTLGSGYNLIQSKVAIGAGQVFGRGFLQGSQSQLHFIPMHHTDFIFAVLGEEWGLVGCAAVLALYLGLLLHGVKVAVQARDLAGTLLCTGVLTLLATQVVINVGMTTGLVPVTGLTLPLLSYGGSSILLFMVCTGILLNVRRESVY
jgi:rod shape determining protein RodA